MGLYLTDRAARVPVADGCTLATPTDPENEGEFRYRAIDADTYEICAIFLFGWPDAEGDAREWQAGGYYYYPGAGQQQRKLKRPASAGESCFEIDAVAFETGEDLTEDEAPSAAENAPEDADSSQE
jgi:hypothetical protein